MAGAHTDLRIVLLGRSGSGKSATANAILGRNVFRENVITSVCKRKQAVVGQRTVIAIDTPGLFNPKRDVNDLITDIKKGACMSALGPHVILLVIRLDMDLTDDERNIVTWIQNNFGNHIVSYTFILFTHADHLNGESVEDHIRRSHDLKLLIDQCQGRFHSFNNRERQNRYQVTDLAEKMEQMVRHNKGQCFNMPPEVTELESDEILKMLGIILGIGMSVAVMILKRSL